MLRALRAVSPSDLETLNHQNLKGWLPLTKRIEYGPDVLGRLIEARKPRTRHGEILRPNPNTTDEQKLASVLEHGTWRTFQLSPFGERFLKFVALGEVDRA